MPTTLLWLPVWRGRFSPTNKRGRRWGGGRTGLWGPSEGQLSRDTDSKPCPREEHVVDTPLPQHLPAGLATGSPGNTAERPRAGGSWGPASRPELVEERL